MSKTLKGVLIGAFGLCLVIGAAIALLFAVGKRLDTESKTFVDSAVPAIVGHWSFPEFEERSTPELRRRLIADGTVLFPSTLTVLGDMTKYDGSSGQAFFSYVIGAGSKTTANYTASAHFQNGRAQFRLTLKKSQGRWLIDNFFVQVFLHTPVVRSTALRFGSAS